MRTTLTLDDDVAAQLEALRRKQDASIKSLVNEALRRGLKEMAAPSAAKTKPFRTEAQDMGAIKISSIDNIAEALAVAEGEAFR